MKLNALNKKGILIVEYLNVMQGIGEKLTGSRLDISQTSVAYIHREKKRRENIMKYLARTKEIPFLSGPYIIIN